MPSTSFADLKKNRSKSTEELTKKLTTNNNANTRDETYWTITRDAAGNGSAIIRFMPAPPGESDPFVRIYDHGFKGPNGHYIEKSLTTIGQPDPMSKLNSKLWDSGEEGKKQARAQKRRLNYHSNIYVVKDPGNPENEGRVFKFRFGAKIFDKLTEATTPDEFGDNDTFDPFDLWEGANFRLIVRKVEDYPNYDKSKFETPAPLFVDKNGQPDEARMEQVWNNTHSLAELIAPDKFKTYEELESRLNRVLGLEDERVTTQAVNTPRKVTPPVADDDVPFDAPFATAPLPDNTASKFTRTATPASEDDEDLQWLKDLED